MWIVYQKKDGTVVSRTALSDRRRKTAPSMKSSKALVNTGPAKNYDAVQVTDLAEDDDHSAAPSRHDRGKLERESASSSRSRKRSRPTAQRRAGQAPVDGIPEIKGDGTAFTTISIQKAGGGEPQASRNDNGRCIRTTAGTLQSADGKTRSNRSSSRTVWPRSG